MPHAGGSFPRSCHAGRLQAQINLRMSRTRCAALRKRTSSCTCLMLLRAGHQDSTNAFACSHAGKRARFPMSQARSPHIVLLHRRTVPALERGHAQAVHAAGGVRGRVQLRDLLVRGHLVQQRPHARRQRRARIAPVPAGRRRVRQPPRQRVEACGGSARRPWVSSVPPPRQAGPLPADCKHAQRTRTYSTRECSACSLQSTRCAARCSDDSGPRASCSLTARPVWRAALP